MVFALAAQLLPGYRLDLADDPRVVALRWDERAVARFNRNVDPEEVRRGAEKAHGAVLLPLLWALGVGPRGLPRTRAGDRFGYKSPDGTSGKA